MKYLIEDNEKAVIAVIRELQREYLAVTSEWGQRTTGVFRGLVEEGILDAIQRELREETGYYIAEEYFNGYSIMKSKGDRRVVFVVSAFSLPST